MQRACCKKFSWKESFSFEAGSTCSIRQPFTSSRSEPFTKKVSKSNSWQWQVLVTEVLSAHTCRLTLQWMCVHSWLHTKPLNWLCPQYLAARPVACIKICFSGLGGVSKTNKKTVCLWCSASTLNPTASDQWSFHPWIFFLHDVLTHFIKRGARVVYQKCCNLRHGVDLVRVLINL